MYNIIFNAFTHLTYSARDTKMISDYYKGDTIKYNYALNYMGEKCSDFFSSINLNIIQLNEISFLFYEILSTLFCLFTIAETAFFVLCFYCSEELRILHILLFIIYLGNLHKLRNTILNFYI